MEPTTIKALILIGVLTFFVACMFWVLYIAPMLNDETGLFMSKKEEKKYMKKLIKQTKENATEHGAPFDEPNAFNPDKSIEDEKKHYKDWAKDNDRL